MIKKDKHYVPGWVVLFIEFFLDKRSNVLLKREEEEKQWEENMKNGNAKMMLCFVSRSGPTFSMLYLDRATEAISTACCCIGSDMSAFFITAFLCSAMLQSISDLVLGSDYVCMWIRNGRWDSKCLKKQTARKQLVTKCCSEWTGIDTARVQHVNQKIVQ